MAKQQYHLKTMAKFPLYMLLSGKDMECNPISFCFKGSAYLNSAHEATTSSPRVYRAQLWENPSWCNPNVIHISNPRDLA